MNFKKCVCIIGKGLDQNEKERGRAWLIAQDPLLLQVFIKLSNGDTEFFPKTMMQTPVIESLRPTEWWKEVIRDNILFPRSLLPLV